MDQGREYLLLNLYQKESKERMSGTDQYNQAVVRDQVLYKFNKSRSICRHVEDGLMVDKEGESGWFGTRTTRSASRRRFTSATAEISRRCRKTRRRSRRSEVEGARRAGSRTRVQEAARPQGHIRRPGAGGEETRDESHLGEARAEEQPSRASRRVSVERVRFEGARRRGTVHR